MDSMADLRACSDIWKSLNNIFPNRLSWEKPRTKCSTDTNESPYSFLKSLALWTNASKSRPNIVPADSPRTLHNRQEFNNQVIGRQSVFYRHLKRYNECLWVFAPYNLHMLKVVYLYIIVNLEIKVLSNKWKITKIHSLTNTGSELQPIPVSQQYVEHRRHKSFQAPTVKISLVIDCSYNHTESRVRINKRFLLHIII